MLDGTLFFVKSARCGSRTRSLSGFFIHLFLPHVLIIFHLVLFLKTASEILLERVFLRLKYSPI